MKQIIKIFASILVLFSNHKAQTEEAINPFSGIGKNSLESFSGINLIYHGAGILSTYVLITSGADYKIHNYFAGNGYSPAFDPAVGIGYIMPVVLGGGLYLFGELKNRSREAAAGSAALQAVIVSAAFSTLLKTLTGRPNPDPGLYNSGNASSEFLFGFMRGGIHFGWPSGHLCTNTALAASLISFYHKSTAVKIAATVYLGYLFYGVIAHDNNTMHWFSDAAAGLLMGYAIGSTIGKNFRHRWYTKENTAAVSNFPEVNPLMLNIGNKNLICITPFLSPELHGLKLGLFF